MEILTLLKANIRHKKGSFVSVILLTLIIAMSVTTVFSIRESTMKGVSDAHELCDTADLQVMYNTFYLADDTAEKVKNDERVKEVRVVDTVLTNKTVMGGNEHNNTMMIYKADENTKILKEDLNGVEKKTPRLSSGEIYVPQGLLTALNGNVGEKIVFGTIAGDYEFTVKGALLEPSFGSSLIGWKKCCICEEDFTKIYTAVANAETEDMHARGKILEIKKAEDCKLSDMQFRRQLNIDTGVLDMAFGSQPKYMSINYTTLFPKVICSALFVFIMLLLAITVIVTVHSISVEIETNYITFGVLKAQGFDKNKIRLLFLGQYLLAEIIGAVLGIALSVPLIGVTSNIFVTITAIPSVTSVPIGMVSVVILALFALSVVSVFLISTKVGKISPVRAISGAKKEIYFDSRIKAPISKKLLSPSLALRQFTSAKRRYIGTLVIVTALVFFMAEVTGLVNTINSKSAMESMGVMISEIDISPKQRLSDEDCKKIEGEIETFSPIDKAYYTCGAYFSFEGEEMHARIYKDPSMLPLISGRSPVYDNEIAVSTILLEEFNLKVGDEITIGYENKKEKYIIAGTLQLTNDVGRSFLISYDAAGRVGFDSWLFGYYSLENGDDEALKQKIADRLNDKFGDILEAKVNGDLLDDSVVIIIMAMQMIIYVFSVLFSLIVVHMVCSKAFIQERTDIGIYKAMGFGTSNLRLQFAVRFLIVSAFGSIIGGLLSYFFSGKILSIFLKSAGITSFKTNDIFASLAIPVILILISFSLFSFLSSGKIKRVKIRELVTE